MFGLWGLGVSSGHIKVWFSPAQLAGQDLTLLVKAWSRGQLCWFDPSVDLLARYNPMATECNLISNSHLLRASFLAPTRNERETVGGSLHIHRFYLKTSSHFPKGLNYQETCESKTMPRKNIIVEQRQYHFLSIVFVS